MSLYCLENGLKHSGNWIVHRVDCPYYDVASLLGAGHISNIGEFTSSCTAVNFVRIRHPDASRCPHCCHADPVVQPLTGPQPDRHFLQKIMPSPRP
jgi:hypothetical protein